MSSHPPTTRARTGAPARVSGGAEPDAPAEGAPDEGPPNGDEADAAALAELLRSRGLRLTAQRQLVLEAVLRLGHATPEQVHQAVCRTAAGVNITTIYRNLELLEGLGLVTHTHLSHGAPTYHAPGKRSHLHLVCHRCGKVSDAPLELMRPLAAELATRRGFTVDIGHMALFGTCADCAAADPAPDPAGDLSRTEENR